MHSSSKLRVPKGLVPAAVALLGAAPVTPLLTPPVLAQATSPRDAVITSSRRGEVTLSIGSEFGAQKGAIYGIMRGGQPQARLQITEVRPNDSTARIVSVETDFVVTVGDAVRFIEMGTLPAVTPPQPPTVTPQPANPVIITPGTQAGATGTSVTPMTPQTPATATRTAPQRGAAMPVSATTAALASVDGANVTLNMGSQRGVKAGSTLPIVRDGNVVALVRVQNVNPADATGTIIWRDETAAPLAVGDMIGVTMGPVMPTFEAEPGVPATPMLFETGASNIGVPTAERDYLYLAGLAAQGLITSQPAHMFHDEGARRHRTAEDFTFTRAQIAGFIKEALASPKAENPSGKSRVALGALIPQYRKDLQALGVSDEALAPFVQSRGFEFGVSGQQRATLVGGDDIPGFILPFSERQGGLRTRSGFDTRTNLWARAGKVNFLGSIDAGTDPRRGINDRNFQVRRAVLSYDAGSLLRGLTVEAGRDELWFGPGHFGTLVLGDTAGPLNMMRAKFKRGSYQVEGVYAPLGSGPTGLKRSLYAKHSYINLGPQTRLGIVESVIQPTEAFDAKLFLGTFSPIPLAFMQRLGDDNSNLAGEVYIESSIARGVRVYGELLADDFGASNNNRIRNRYGSLLGAHLFTPKNPTKLGVYAEFVNLQGRTYLDLGANRPGYDAYYNGFPLGYPVAPVPGFPLPGSAVGLGGAETLRFEGYWRPTRKLRLVGGFEYADLNSELTLPNQNLSRQQILRLRASYDLRRDITLTARAMRVSTSQPNFVLNEPKIQQKLFSLEVARAF